MKVKLTCGLIIVMFILNAVFLSWNYEFRAEAPESHNQHISSDLPETLSNGVFNWSQMMVLSEPLAGQNFNIGNSSVPRIAVENDNIYVVWNDENNTNGAGSDRDIFFRYYNGTSWSKIEVISEPVPGQNNNQGWSVQAEIAVENGNIYVVWLDTSNINGAGSDWDIFYRCNLTGSNWEDIQVLSEPVLGKNLNTGTSSTPSIAVENGEIYVAWSDDNNTNGAGTNDQDIFYRCNLTGTSWEDVQVISEPVEGQDINIGNSGGPNIAVENGNIYVVWVDNNDTNGAGWTNDIFYRCNLTGSSWEPVQVISEPVFGKDYNIHWSYLGSIAVENGDIFVVWSDGNNTNGAGGDPDISFRCNLTGSSWEPIQVISEPVFGQNYNTGQSQGPIIAVKNNQIHVVWVDLNNTNGAGSNDWDIFYRSNLTGITWGSIQVISEPVFGQNFNTGGSFLPESQCPSIAVNDKVHIVWDDDNNTDGSGTDDDILYRRKYVVLPSLFLNFPRVNPKIGNTSTEFNFTVKYYQLNNTSPTSVKVKIDGNEHWMLENDQNDINYTDGKQYFFNIKNLDIGFHTYEFNASDGVNYTNTKLFSNLIVLNTLPQIINEDNLTAIEDYYYEVTYEFEDIDIANIGQDCHWEFETNANWLNFDPITGKLFGTPGNDDVGEYWVYIAVNDTRDIVFTNFTLTVIDINDDPIIVTNNVEVTNEDEYYEVDYNATDIDSQIENQYWSLKTNATSWLNLSSTTGILNGTPGNSEVGEYWINITINDIEGGFDFTNFTLTVLNVNDRPEIITLDSLDAETDKLYKVDYNATDIDSPSSEQAWSLSTNASWLSIDPNTGVLSGTPTRSQVGWYVVNVTVSDGDGGIDWYEFIITVYKGNLPPVITTEDVETTMVNKSYEVDYNATDDRTHPNFLSWALETNASWLSIDKTMGILSGTPDSEHGGKQYWVKVTVFDHENGMDLHNFTLTVLKEPKPKNKIPRLANFKMKPLDGDTETEFTFSVNYFDIENELPTLIQVVIDGIVYDMILSSGENAYNGKYEFITTLSEGEHTYYFTASDGKNTNTSETFTTPKIELPVEVDNGETKKEGFAWEWLILTIVIVVIVVLIFVFLMIRRKKKEEWETIPAIQPETKEYETQEPSVQEDLYYTPPEEQATVSPMPDYTTPVQPEPEYESFEQTEQTPVEDEFEELEE
jgi:hypothetical protein